MAYFPRNMRIVERSCKLVADLLLALLILVFAIVFFGPLGGLLAFIILEGALLGVDYLMPDDVTERGQRLDRPLFVCLACDQRGADVRPHFGKQPKARRAFYAGTNRRFPA